MQRNSLQNITEYRRTAGHLNTHRSAVQQEKQKCEVRYWPQRSRCEMLSDPLGEYTMPFPVAPRRVPVTCEVSE